MICDRSNVGKFSGCSICMGVDTSNGAFVYSWIDYLYYNPCGVCWVDSFGYPAVYTNRYANTCFECRNLPAGPNGLSAGPEIKLRKAEDYGYDPKCYSCKEKIGFFGQKSYSFEYICDEEGYECDENGVCVNKDGTCVINGQEVILPSCHSCIHVPNWGMGSSAVRIVNDCEGDHNHYGNIIFPASNLECVDDSCVCGIENCPKSRPTLKSNGHNIYSQQHDPGCWCECDKDALILAELPPCAPDEKYDAANCKCEYDASAASILNKKLMP
jgi:hypothetical protein